MAEPFILPFYDTLPAFAAPLREAGARSAVLGRATLGTDVWIGEDCVIRADGQIVRIGDNVFLGQRATVHIVHDILPAIIGSNVTVGNNSLVHACTAGNNIVIEDDVTVLDEAVVEDHVLIEAGSTVFPRKVLKSGFVYAGTPAKEVRPLETGELQRRAAAIRARRTTAKPLPAADHDFGDAVFIAATTQRAGAIEFAPGSSLFFSCVADAGAGRISVGENTNIQDNTIMRVDRGELVVGRDTTIGHNVKLGPGHVGSRSLIGMGAVLAAGTIVEDDVLLAAGATTEPGQVLESGWLWAGRPAKPLAKLDDARRSVMVATVTTYCEYSQTFRRLQQAQVAKAG